MVRTGTDKRGKAERSIQGVYGLLDAHHRDSGYKGKATLSFYRVLPPFEFCAAIILNGAKTELDLGNYDLAIKCCDEVIEKYRGTLAVPEAIFYVFVAKYLSTHDPKNLRAGFDRLTREFPGAEWTIKATPYKLIAK